MSERQIKKSLEDTEKEGRGPGIPYDWKQYIMWRAETEDNKPRMWLAVEILEQMERSRDRKDKLPEKESIAKLISRARNHPKETLDSPWSLGALAEHPIPPEAAQDLLEVWKDCVQKGFRLTIRQANWVARLRGFFSDKPWGEIYDWACLYAGRERANHILGGEVLNTSDLDALIVFKSPVYQAAVGAGAVPGWDFGKRMEALEAGGPELAQIELIEIASRKKLGHEGFKMQEREHKALLEAVKGKAADCPPEKQLEAYEVMLLWTTAFWKRGAKVKAMQREAWRTVLERLFDEVLDYIKNPWGTWTPEEGPPPIGVPWRPSEELLKEVSYEA